MRPRTQKQPQVKKELCRVLDDVDVDVEMSKIINLLTWLKNILLKSRPKIIPMSDKYIFSKAFNRNVIKQLINKKTFAGTI